MAYAHLTWYKVSEIADFIFDTFLLPQVSPTVQSFLHSLVFTLPYHFCQLYFVDEENNPATTVNKT